MTVRQLYNSGIRVASTRRFPPSSKTRRIVGVVPYIGTKSILFQLEHYGITQAAQHAIYIMFSGLHITEDEQDTGYYLVIPHKDKKLFVQKPDYDKTKIRVRCSCLDFYHTYALWDYNSGCLFGTKPRPYKRKTTTRPPRNPNHYPGMCKHIYNSLLLFQTNEWTNRTGTHLSGE